MDTIAGLPVHPLIVHGVVVLGPLAAVLLLAYALVPKWRVGLRWPTLLLAAASMAMGKVAEESGEKLEHRVGGGGDSAESLIERHAEAGELAMVALGLLLVATVVTVFLLAPARGRRSAQERGGFGALGMLALLISLAAGAFVGWAVFDAGHSGASSVWSGLISTSNG